MKAKHRFIVPIRKLPIRKLPIYGLLVRKLPVRKLPIHGLLVGKGNPLILGVDIIRNRLDTLIDQSGFTRVIACNPYPRVPLGACPPGMRGVDAGCDPGQGRVLCQWQIVAKQFECKAGAIRIASGLAVMRYRSEQGSNSLRTHDQISATEFAVHGAGPVPERF
jgi:hypothetical protein